MFGRVNYILIGCLLIGSAVVAQLPGMDLLDLSQISQIDSYIGYIEYIEECNEIEDPRRFILCYSNEQLKQVDVCRCSHLVVPLTVNTSQKKNGSLALDGGKSSSDPLSLFSFPLQNEG